MIRAFGSFTGNISRSDSQFTSLRLGVSSRFRLLSLFPTFLTQAQSGFAPKPWTATTLVIDFVSRTSHHRNRVKTYSTSGLGPCQRTLSPPALRLEIDSAAISSISADYGCACEWKLDNEMNIRQESTAALPGSRHAQPRRLELR